MKKNLIILSGIIGLTACATVNWQGQNFDSYVAQYGAPTSSYKMQNGNTTYTYKTACPYTNGDEEKIIVVDSNNIIQQATLRVRCPSAYEHKEYNEQVDATANYLREEQVKQTDALNKEKNRIAFELLNMGSELEQKAKLASIETKAISAEAKKKTGIAVTAEEAQLIKNAEQARKNFDAWKKRHDELSAELERLKQLQ